ncbi:MAG TPA: cell division protein FtsL [Polyangiales bacterium]|nr:cell division protein FtsL [Polyangiales bacterium]
MSPKFLFTWKVSIVASTLAFLVHVTLCIENAELGYKLSKALNKERELRGQRTLLQLEAATLGQLKRVETVAKNNLGMEVPSRDRVILVGARNAGRTR